MRILFIPAWYPTKGQPIKGIFFQEQAKALAGENDVCVLYPPLEQGVRSYFLNRPNNKWIEDPPGLFVKYFVYPWKRDSRGIFSSMVSHCKQAIGKNQKQFGKFDIILANASSSICLATECSKHFKMPVVFVEHSYVSMNEQMNQNYFLKKGYNDAICNTDLVCVVSDALRRNMIMHLAGLSLNPVVIGNFIDTDFFNIKSHDSFNRPLKIIAVVSNDDDRHKDVNTLIKAIVYIRETKPSLELAVQIIGLSGSVSEYYATVCSKEGITEVVMIEGQKTRSEVRDAMQSADLFVSSSIQETFGIVIAESLSCGTPVVATRSGGAEFILGNDSPFLVEIREPAQLGSKIIDVLEGKVSYDPVRCRAEIVNRFGNQAFVKRVVDLLHTVIADYKRRQKKEANLFL